MNSPEGILLRISRKQSATDDRDLNIGVSPGFGGETRVKRGLMKRTKSTTLNLLKVGGIDFEFTQMRLECLFFFAMYELNLHPKNLGADFNTFSNFGFYPNLPCGFLFTQLDLSSYFANKGDSKKQLPPPLEDPKKTATNGRQSWQFCKNTWSPSKKLVVFGTSGRGTGENFQKQDESNLRVDKTNMSETDQ